MLGTSYISGVVILIDPIARCIIASKFGLNTVMMPLTIPTICNAIATEYAHGTRLKIPTPAIAYTKHQVAYTTLPVSPVYAWPNTMAGMCKKKIKNTLSELSRKKHASTITGSGMLGPSSGAGTA